MLLVACLSAGVALAQQDPLYTQYINNPFVLNPAYAGITNNLNASLSYRRQWTGLEGTPATINANGHISLLDNTMGAGLMIVSDRIGVTTTNEVYASYAYRIGMADDKMLSFGLQAGIISFKTENSRLVLQDPADPRFAGKTRESKPGIGSGVMLTGDRFLIGLSVPRMLRARTTGGEADVTHYNQHFYAMGSYLFLLSDRLQLRPSVLAKAVPGAPVSLDVNAALVLYERYTAGMLTRNFSAYGIFLRALVKDSLRLGYALEVPTNRSVGTQFTTHEITLGIGLKALSFHSNGSVTGY